ncbi:asparaginase [Denitromonas ohlonensis]|uniref:Asparaginase n=2 Tax=Denitromonas TaxID=139331 RepID=A0A558E9F4_9RHOO|nr:asparaginase [Denitromonas ohlonensis]TVT45324.1 MAG: asparaginase [Denitromonas halophila]TVO68047.1 asparaginase [Denitromonas ohlonensis]TVO78048.1 asparaginase [Denitromonas ohlonensis]TVT69870.1 MAG: asparaginase [Denitromonas halophila]TVT78500.1 MAG: asparaginase [Denitromonas halophila]
MSTTPRLTLITTGGTIAGQAASAADTTGYTAGALDPSALIAAVPGLTDLAQLRADALFSIDSKDMSPAHWLTLLARVRHHLAQAECDGVVITHGTDTLEETAFFLHLTTPPGKPIVLTAAMRPASALSADGPMNLYQAVAVAAHASSANQGVLVVVNGHIFAAADIVKTDTQALDAIAAPARGPLGAAQPVQFYHPAALTQAGCVSADALAGQTGLPRVDILYVAAGCDPDLLTAAIERGAQGIVLALPGNGSLPVNWARAALAAQTLGVAVIRSTRVAHGRVAHAADAAVPAASGALNPAKARIALMLALAIGTPELSARLFT